MRYRSKALRVLTAAGLVFSAATVALASSAAASTGARHAAVADASSRVRHRPRVAPGGPSPRRERRARSAGWGRALRRRAPSSSPTTSLPT